MDNEKAGVDLIGVGKAASAIPPKSWHLIARSLTTNFEKIISPISESLGGGGQLLKIYFEKQAELKRLSMADALNDAKQRIDEAKVEVTGKGNWKTIKLALEEVSDDTDEEIRNLWVNLISRELSEGSIHPRILKILSQLAPIDAQIVKLVTEEYAKRNDESISEISAHINIESGVPFSYLLNSAIGNKVEKTLLNFSIDNTKDLGLIDEKQTGKGLLFIPTTRGLYIYRKVICSIKEDNQNKTGDDNSE